MNDADGAQAHITGFWTTIAAGYEAHGGNVAEADSAEYQRWVEALVAVLPEPPGDVLDVATGTGYVALAAASLGHRVTATDLAPAMLDELVAHAKARGLTVDARLGDAVAPRLPAGQLRRGHQPAPPLDPSRAGPGDGQLAAAPAVRRPARGGGRLLVHRRRR